MKGWKVLNLQHIWRFGWKWKQFHNQNSTEDKLLSAEDTNLEGKLEFKSFVTTYSKTSKVNQKFIFQLFQS